MEVVVIVSGRYHPFHLGHKASYDYVSKMFGADSVYIATSAKQAPVTSPFTYDDKVKMMTTLGIPSSHIVQTKNPYNATEITNQITDPENTVVVYAVSEKDMEGESPRFKFSTKKDGSPSYLQPLPDNLKKCKPMTEHAYVVTVPTVTFKVLGQDANSATQLRKLYIESDDNTREHIIADLYGRLDPTMKEIFDDRLSVTEATEEMIRLGKKKSRKPVSRNSLKENTTRRLIRNIQAVILAESIIQRDYSITPTEKPGYKSEK